MQSPRFLKGILTGILTAALAASVLPDADLAMDDVIVRGTDLSAVLAAVEAHGGQVETEIGLIDAVSADVPVDLLDDLEADARTTEVVADAAITLHGKDKDKDKARGDRGITGRDGVHLLGGRKAMRPGGFDGSGIDIALVDSGIDADALPGTKVARGVNLSFDETWGDGFGHGTAMAGIIAGDSTTHQGVAADARLIDVKVADANGVADVSQVLAAIDWVVSNRDTDGRDIRVLSLSFGTDGVNPASTSPLAFAVEAAWRHGIVVVTSAGNHGRDLGRLASPATDPWVIAVGAADVTDIKNHKRLDEAVVPSWSAWGDGTRNPDLVAPGTSMLGGRAKDSTIERENPGAAADGMLLGSGTSQATAFTSGVVAAMLEADPDLTPDRTKALLRAAAQPLAADERQAGQGMLDLGALFDKRALAAPRVEATQSHEWSDGTGSLDGDRGSFVLEADHGERLVGQETVVGAFDADAWRSSTWTGSTWTSSTWTGSTWTGSTWTGSTWTGSTWTSSTWTSSTWTGSTWTSAHWGE